jgi:hypothetical protein
VLGYDEFVEELPGSDGCYLSDACKSGDNGLGDQGREMKQFYLTPDVTM